MNSTELALITIISLVLLTSLLLVINNLLKLIRTVQLESSQSKDEMISMIQREKTELLSLAVTKDLSGFSQVSQILNQNLSSPSNHLYEPVRNDDLTEYMKSNGADFSDLEMNALASIPWGN